MEFGILFTSHPNTEAEPYPHRDVHARVTPQILRADALGYDYAWVAEHHFSNEYGIMPDVFVYAGYLAALTKRIKIGTAVVTLPLANPLRVAENTAFVDILSNGRFALGLGSGYRKYEFDGFGVDFDARRDIQEEALPLLLRAVALQARRSSGRAFPFQGRRSVRSVSARAAAAASAGFSRRRHRPLDRGGRAASGSGCSCRAGRRSPNWRGRAQAIARCSTETPQMLRDNPARGHVDVARWVYVAESDAKAKRESEPGIMRNLAHFCSGHTSGYLGTVSQDVGAKPRDYDTLVRDIILHGSPATVIEKIEELQHKVRNASIMLHFPPWYGTDKALASLELFAAEVMPKFRDASRTQKRA